MISLPATATPRRSASRRTASNATWIGVLSKFVRFIETWTSRRLVSATPIAFTQGSPPLEKRTVFAMAFATSRSPDCKLTLYAMSGGRAPTAVAPAVGCNVRGPKSGAHAGSVVIRPANPSSPPLRKASRFARSGCEAACAYRKTGMFNSLPIRSPTRLASATQSSIVTPRIGTNGTTSVAPTRGCPP